MALTKITLAAGLVVVVAVGVGVPIVAQAGDKPDPTFRALHRAAGGGDRLPAKGSGPLASVDPARARKVGTIDGRDVYLAPGPQGSLCVLDVVGQDVGGMCAGRDTIKEHPVYSAWREGNSDTAAVVVPVPDAYEEAIVGGQRVPVAENVALAHVHTGRSAIRLSGDQGTIEADLNLDQ